MTIRERVAIARELWVGGFYVCPTDGQTISSIDTRPVVPCLCGQLHVKAELEPSTAERYIAEWASRQS